METESRLCDRCPTPNPESKAVQRLFRPLVWSGSEGFLDLEWSETTLVTRTVLFFLFTKSRTISPGPSGEYASASDYWRHRSGHHTWVRRTSEPGTVLGRYPRLTCGGRAPRRPVTRRGPGSGSVGRKEERRPGHKVGDLSVDFPVPVPSGPEDRSRPSLVRVP